MDLRNTRILVVAEDDVQAHQLGRSLAGQGLEAEAASGVDGALLAAGRQKPEIVIIEAETGESNGYELCRRLKREERLADVPLLLLSRLSIARGVLTRLTESDTAEEDHQAQRFLEQKMEAVGRLAGVAAHDFNNLLMVIGGFAEVLSRQIPPDDGKARVVAEIRKATDRAAALTEQLLVFGGRQASAAEELDLNDVVRGAADSLRRVLGASAALEIGADPSLWRIHASRGAMEQLLTNLLANTRDAMPDGGRVTIETANFEVEDARAGATMGIAAGRYVRLSVSDTGTGMSREAMAHLFEPFFTTKEHRRGGGLGLATVYGIVTQSGGRIRCASEPGKGTRFTIHFPRSENAAPVA